MEHHKPGHDETMEMPKIDMKDVDLGGAFKQFVEILKLNKKVIEGVAGNAKAGASAAIFLLVGAAAAPLAQFIFGVRFLNVVYRPDIVHVLVQWLLAVVMAVGVIFVTTVVANKLFKGKGSFAGYFKVMGLMYGVNVLTAVGFLVPALAPLLGLVVGIWMLVVSFYAIQAVFKLDNTNTVLTMIVAVVAMVAIMAVIGSLGYGAAYSTIDLSNISVRY